VIRVWSGTAKEPHAARVGRYLTPQGNGNGQKRRGGTERGGSCNDTQQKIRRRKRARCGPIGEGNEDHAPRMKEKESNLGGQGKETYIGESLNLKTR